MVVVVVGIILGSLSSRTGTEPSKRVNGALEEHRARVPYPDRRAIDGGSRVRRKRHRQRRGSFTECRQWPQQRSRKKRKRGANYRTAELRRRLSLKMRLPRKRKSEGLLAAHRASCNAILMTTSSWTIRQIHTLRRLSRHAEIRQPSATAADAAAECHNDNDTGSIDGATIT